MNFPGHRFGAIARAAGFALCVVTACGGAASTPLDKPAPTQHGGDNTTGGLEASTSSSGGGGSDATVAEDATVGDDTHDAARDAPAQDDVESPPEASPADDAPMCGVCPIGNRCCMTPGAISFGQCYNLLCGPCCL
jgi:hypothetical protein